MSILAFVIYRYGAALSGEEAFKMSGKKAKSRVMLFAAMFFSLI